MAQTSNHAPSKPPFAPDGALAATSRLVPVRNCGFAHWMKEQNKMKSHPGYIYILAPR